MEPKNENTITTPERKVLESNISLRSSAPLLSRGPITVGSFIGKYKVEARLGRGGMAEVFKAYQENLDRHVAIKLIHNFLAEEEDFLQRFQREARAMAATKHPNIVDVFDFVAEDDYYYIVMEYLDGGTLKEHIEHLIPGALLPLEKSVQIVLEMADALSFAHNVGMVHRDIKPANIMFDQRGSAVLTDFGIAKMLSGPSYTTTGAMIGTPAYMSPEQGLGETGDERSDLYALGILFYQLTTGRLPHDGETPLTVILKHVNEIPPAPRLLNPELPASLERVILKAMAKEPRDRYQSAQQMAQELRDALILSENSKLQAAIPTLLVQSPRLEKPAPTQTANGREVDQGSPPSEPHVVDPLNDTQKSTIDLTRISEPRRPEPEPEDLVFDTMRFDEEMSEALAHLSATLKEQEVSHQEKPAETYKEVKELPQWMGGLAGLILGGGIGWAVAVWMGYEPAILFQMLWETISGYLPG